MRKIVWVVAIGSLLLAAVVLPYRFRPPATVWFFDVGQGDAAFIDSRGYQVLFDGGPDRRVLSELGRTMPLGDRTIDLVVLSHPHADHYRGLKDVFARYRVATLAVSGVAQPDPEYESWISEVKARGTAVTEVSSGTSIPLPSGQLKVVGPVKPLAGEQMTNLNDASVVVVAQLESTKILFPGDAEETEERELVRQGADLDTDILKVPHHGSRTSSTLEFVSAVSPQVAVVSVGTKNRYGHPASQTLEMLHNNQVNTYRTDQQGTVKLTIRPTMYQLQTRR